MAPLVTTTPFQQPPQPYMIYKLRFFASGEPGSANGGWTTTARWVRSDQWNHIAMSYSGNAFGINSPIFYVNGVSVASIETDNPSGTMKDDNLAGMDLTIGNPSFTTSTATKPTGYYDEFSVWRSIQSAGTISTIAGSSPANYQTTVSGFSPDLYWKLDDTGNTIADSSGNAVDGEVDGPDSPVTDVAVQQSGYANQSIEIHGDDKLNFGNNGNGINTGTANIWNLGATFMGWYRPAQTGPTLPTAPCIFSKFDNNVGVGLSLGWLLFCTDGQLITP